MFHKEKCIKNVNISIVTSNFPCFLFVKLEGWKYIGDEKKKNEKKEKKNIPGERESYSKPNWITGAL